VAVISATGFAEELEPHVSHMVDPRVGIDDLGPSYASAQVVLVPSFATSGSKTTILQAWAARRPVVTTEASAHSVGARDGYDVAVGNSGEDLVRRCREVLSDSSLASQLIEAGSQSLRERHSEAAVRTSLVALLGDVLEGAP
jgi:glycosyltransferase involved in cell wall biosynthesis